MLYFLVDFVVLAIDGLMDTGVLFSAVIEMEFRKFRPHSPQLVIRKVPSKLSNNSR